ncbi:MAG: BTAD domain-containing putative transcriptional regulator [Candidatus Promineifilaceae bacterium]
MARDKKVPGEFPHQEIKAALGDISTLKSLLENREYDQLARLLKLDAAESDESPIASSLILAARQLCQVCIDYQEQKTHFQQLQETAVTREKEMRTILQTMLILLEKAADDQVIGPLVSEGIEAAVLEEDVGQPGFWRRVQALLGLAPAEAEKPKLPAVVTTEEEVEQATSSVISLEEERSTILSASFTSEPTPQELSLQLESSAAVPAEEAGPRSASLVIYCLGPFRIYQINELITEWDGWMGQKILKYLVAQRGKPVPKEVLMELMWADVGQEAQRRNLHQAIYSLRQTLRRREPNLQQILFQNDNYLLNPATDVWIDFIEFETYAHSGQRLEAAGETEKAFKQYGMAEGLYQGAFLEEDLYEEWTKSQRDYLHNLYLEIANRLSEYFLNRSDNVSAIALCQKVLGQDPYFEAAHRHLMICYCEQGLRHLAVRQYQILVELLATELGLEPDPETTALYQKIT